MSDVPTDELRIDDLAAAAGVATTTVRLYQRQGLLPGPRLIGRTGWYGPAHLARLRLIGRLQEDGFSLAGIARLLESWESGRDLTDLVGVEEQLDALLHRTTALVLRPEELAARFPAEVLTPELMAGSIELGLAELTDDGRIRIPDARFLDVGAELITLGLPAAVVLDEWRRLTKQTDTIAQRFVRLFEEHLLPDDWQHELDSATAQELARTLARLQHSAGQVLLAALDASIAKVGAKRLGQLVAQTGD